MVHQQMQVNIKKSGLSLPFKSNQLGRPHAVVFKQRALNNITRFVNKTNKLGYEFRPHFKTHQSREIGRWFKKAGVTGITVSSVEMAQYFSDDGWDDITIAFPFFPGQIDLVNKISENCTLRLIVTDIEITRWLAEHLNNSVDIMLEIDAGYDRSGIDINDKSLISETIGFINESDNLKFSGFYIHDGATYKVNSTQEIKSIISRDLQAFDLLKKEYPDVKYCLGDTPSCSLLNNFGPVNELSPGNFIFYDLMQYKIGSCSSDDIAMLVKAPVAQIKMDEDQIIIHGGAAHLSKDYIFEDDKPVYGKPVYFDKDQKLKLVEESSVIALSQEHGIISGAEALVPYINDDNSIWICPVHSCLTANLFSVYHTDENNKISKRILS